MKVMQAGKRVKWKPVLTEW